MQQAEADEVVRNLASALGTYEPVSDDTMPEKTLEGVEKYPFSQAAKDFDNNVLRRQVPHYDTIRCELAAAAADVLVENGSRRPCVVQYGCSDGVDLFGIASELTHDHGQPLHFHQALERTRFVGVDLAQEMVEEAKAKADALADALASCSEPQDVNFRFEEADAVEFARNLDGQYVDVALCMLILQFMPMDHRVKLLGEVHRTLKPGGALLITEKLLPANPSFDEMFTRLYHEEKRRAGMSEEAIDRKYRSLPSYLNRLTYASYHELLVGAGFASRGIEILTKSYHFTTIIARKAEA